MKESSENPITEVTEAELARRKKINQRLVKSLTKTIKNIDETIEFLKSEGMM